MASKYIIGVLTLCTLQYIHCNDDTLVQTKQGQLQGEIKESILDKSIKYYSYKGIPYAAPPVGELRFKAPQPPLPWEGIREAIEHGPKCPQKDIFTDTIELGNEDCLFLNVYSPNIKPDTPLPVMVFIHGGGFKSGSGNDDNYGPDFIVTRGVVLVTLNYRLDVLGFLCLDTEEVPGNAGLKDQVAALRWVKDNISNFGGDPDNITVFGQSAGGASTSLHILSPMSKGLFKRAVPMSGVPLCDWSLAFVPQQRAFLLGKDLGFETNDPNELLEFLRGVPSDKLIDTNTTVLSFEEYNNNILKLYHFTPVVEKDFGQEHFLTVEPLEVLKSKKINAVDMLLGSTSEESLIGIPKFEQFLIKQYNRFPELEVPRKMLMNCTPHQILEISKRIHAYYFKDKSITIDSMKEFVTYTNHVSFLYDIDRFLLHYPKVGDSKTYVYKFSAVSERNVYGKLGEKYGIQGTSHLDDLMYLLNANQYNLTVEKNTREYDLISLATDVFTNFAKYGTPTPDSSLGTVWPEYDYSTKNYVEIADTLTPRSTPEPEMTEFWKSIFGYIGFEY